MKTPFSSWPGKGMRVACLLLLSLLLSSCSTWFSQDFKVPDVQLVNVDLVYARLLEQEFLLEFRIDNPNEQSLPIRGMTYDVKLNDIRLGRGQSNQWLTVPAYGDARFNLHVHTNMWQHVRSLMATLKDPNQPIRYSLDAELKTGMMFNKKVPIRRQGSFTPGDFLRDSN